MVGSPLQKTPLWLRLTLLASLAANMLFLGAVAGFLILGAPDRRADRDRGDAGLFYTRALNEEDRRALRRNFMSGLREGGPGRDAVLADLETTLTTLRATPFDIEAFATAMADQSRGRARREEIGRQLLVKQIASMSDQDRAAYADRIEAQLDDLAQRVRR